VDGRRLVTGSDNGSVSLWEWHGDNTVGFVHSYIGHDAPVSAHNLAVYLLTYHRCTQQTRCRVCRWATVVSSVPATTRRLCCFVIRSTLVCSQFLRRIHEWDAREEGPSLATYRGHTAAVHCYIARQKNQSKTHVLNRQAWRGGRVICTRLPVWEPTANACTGTPALHPKACTRKSCRLPPTLSRGIRRRIFSRSVKTVGRSKKFRSHISLAGHVDGAISVHDARHDTPGVVLAAFAAHAGLVAALDWTNAGCGRGKCECFVDKLLTLGGRRFFVERV
jgi:WD40 repeat protein